MVKHQPSLSSSHHCRGFLDIDHHIVGEVSPIFGSERHELYHSDLFWWCNHLNLSIHDRHLVQDALNRGENMQQFAQGIIRKGCA